MTRDFCGFVRIILEGCLLDRSDLFCGRVVEAF
jgi:hypothetical protein